MRASSAAAAVLVSAAAATAQAPPAEPPPSPRPHGAPSPRPQLPGGLRWLPSLAVTEVYDDNVFFSAQAPLADTIHRFEPGLELRYHGRRTDLSARYGLDAELFREHPELDTPTARQQAEATLSVEGLTTSWLARGSYYRTRTPGELNRTTALQVGRMEADRLAGEQSLTQRFGARTSGTLHYDVSRDRLVGTAPTLTHTARGELARQSGPRDTARLSYIFRLFDFGRRIASHLVMVGWDHDVDPRTRLELRAGPRRTEGRLEPELAASLRRRFRNGELAASYSRTETTALGERGLLRSEGAGASLSWQPWRRLELATAPGYFNDTGEVSDVKVLRVDSHALLKATRWLWLTASHQFALQRGSFAGPGRDELRHHTLALQLRLAAPPPDRDAADRR